MHSFFPSSIFPFLCSSSIRSITTITTTHTEGKTDYYARQRLIYQDKRKYGTPKYRFVVRFTNRDIICQIVAADMKRDVCIASAYSHELRRYGVKTGFKNYAAAYATGLLLARRVNQKFKLDYEGNLEVDGTDYNVEQEGDRKPFKAYLDVGLARATTGARLFGALKGACDGGLDIPHNDRRFPGTTKDGKEYSADPVVHRNAIFGQNIADYMKELKEEDEAAYQRQFRSYIEAGVSPEDIPGIWEAVHKAIREDPNKARGSLELGAFQTRASAKDPEFKYPEKRWHRTKTSLAQRKDRIRQKLAALARKRAAAAAEE